MINRQLKEYLNTFPDDADVSVILANPRNRKLYEVVDAFCIIGEEKPIFCIDVGNESDMDSELVEVCEECESDADNLAGQMNITDFPEVMP